MFRNENSKKNGDMSRVERRRLGGNPGWMSRLPEELLDVPLWNLAIPGKNRNIIHTLCIVSTYFWPYR